MKKYIVIQLLFLFGLSPKMLCQVDTFFVKTEFKTKIDNGALSNKRLAVCQYTYYDDNKLARVITYDTVKGLPEMLTYFFYNNIGQLILCEDFNSKNELIAYKQFSYKDKQLIEKKSFSVQRNKSPALQKEVSIKYNNKLVTHKCKDGKIKTTKTIENNENNDPLKITVQSKNNPDFSFKEINYTYSKDTVQEIKTCVLNNSDTVKYELEKYVYFSNGKLDKIETYDLNENKALLKTKVIRFDNNMRIINYRITDSNKKYLEQITYKYKILPLDFPKRETVSTKF